MQNSNYSIDEISKFNFLVTGGAGFIGSNLVGHLLRCNAKKVRVLDNFSTGFRKNIQPFLSNPSFELVEGDIRELEACRYATSGMDFVSHQAALGSVPRSINDPITTNQVNVDGFLNMLVASKDAQIRQFVYAASSSTYGDHPDLPKIENKIGAPLSPYAVTKYVNELYASVFFKTYNFRSIGLRYFNVFGPHQNPNGAYAAVIPIFITAALKKQHPIINGDGETSRDFTFVNNAVQANIKALLNNNILGHEVVNIACGEQTTLNSLWQQICNLLDIEAVFKYTSERKGDVKHSLADVRKARDLIGYNPDISFFEGLKLTVQWYKENLTTD